MTEQGEPPSFQIVRGSEAVSRLKDIVSNLLPQFSNDYSDGVLADYITVLVCNGKSGRQVVEDLEAFLGEQSEGFITCLWELLRKEFSCNDQEIFPSYPVTAAEFGSPDALNCRHSNSEEPKDYMINTSIIGNGEKGKVENTSVISATTNVSSSEVNEMRILQHKSINGSSRRVTATEKEDWCPSPFSCSRDISSIVVSDFPQPDDMNPGKYEKHTVHKSSEILQQLYLPKEEMIIMDSQSVRPGLVSEGSHDAHSHWKLKPRVSVWDRLGSPKSDQFVDLKNPRMLEIGTQSHEKQKPQSNEPAFLATNSENMKRFQQDERHMTHNLTSKRRYDNISPKAGGAVSQVSSVLYREPSLDVKRPNSLSHQSVKSDLLSEILNAKQKLHQIEMQMRQSKQLKRQKVGVLPSESGELQDRQDDVESRTIHVSNVHFAATKEAISVFFAKCGPVESVVIVTNPETWKSIGVAFVTFVRKDSVEEAISLSGSTFYSRTVKVVRVTQIAGGTEMLTKTDRSTLSCQHNRWSRHLEWRRNSATAPITSEAPITDKQ